MDRCTEYIDSEIFNKYMIYLASNRVSIINLLLKLQLIRFDNGSIHITPELYNAICDAITL